MRRERRERGGWWHAALRPLATPPCPPGHPAKTPRLPSASRAGHHAHPREAQGSREAFSARGHGALSRSPPQAHQAHQS
eukprot:6247057-Prymnesium_polylepis.1